MPHSTAKKVHSNRLLISLAVLPIIFLALSFACAVAVTQWLSPGTAGADALVMSAVLVGLIGGFCCAKINPNFSLHAAVYAASFTCLLYFSFRLFWLNAELNMAAIGFILIIPAALIGAITANKLNKA